MQETQAWNGGRPAPSLEDSAALMERVLYEVKRVVVGQDVFLERMLIAILAQGHLLIEGVPGLAKTLTVNTLARAIQGSFKRIQFTPDLLPADLIGTQIYNQKTSEFSTVLGPVFTNLLLADEINRAPAKVQSALLEVMQERQVTIAGQTHKVPSPFLVMATQNPIETEGTYPLPEAQVDRFMMKVLIDYPKGEEEFVIVQRVIGAAIEVSAVATTEQIQSLQKQSRSGYVDPGSCQQRCPFFHAACFKFIDSLMCSFGGFNQTSVMGCQLRVARLFQRFGMSRLACSYTWWRLSNIC